MRLGAPSTYRNPLLSACLLRRIAVALPAPRVVRISLLVGRTAWREVGARLYEHATRALLLGVATVGRMLPAMLGVGRENHKILYAVIQLVPVPMVDRLIGRERTAEFLFHKQAVLKDTLAVHQDSPVASRVDTVSAAPAHVSLAATGESVAALAAIGVAAPARCEGNAALRARLGWWLRSWHTSIIPKVRFVVKGEYV